MLTTPQRHILPRTQIRHHPQHMPNRAAPNQAPNIRTKRKKPRPHGLHQKQPLFPGRLNENPRLRCIDRKRLFAQNVLPGVEAEHCILEVVRVRRGDVDDVDRWICCEGCVGGVGSGAGRRIAGLEELCGFGEGG